MDANRPRFCLDKSLQSTVDVHTLVQHADRTLIRSSTATDQALLIVLDEDNYHADESTLKPVDSQTHEISVKHEDQEPIVDSQSLSIGQYAAYLVHGDTIQRSVLS
jgi:urease accessory protein UreE